MFLSNTLVMLQMQRALITLDCSDTICMKWLTLLPLPQLTGTQEVKGGGLKEGHVAYTGGKSFGEKKLQGYQRACGGKLQKGRLHTKVALAIF